jgi:hypothetical protein
MSARAAAWIAGSVLAVTVPLHVIATVLGWVRPPLEGVAAFTSLDVLWSLSFVAFAVVGAVVAVRRPDHPMGWLFLGAGGGPVIAGAAYEYGLLALLLDRDLPGGEFAAWLSAWTWAPGLGLVVVALVLFPTCLPLAPRWWPVAWLAAGTTALVAASNAVDLWRFRGPLLLRFGDTPAGPLEQAWSMRLMAMAWPVFLLSAIVAMVGLVVRFVRSRGEERLQLKVLAFVAAVGAVALAVEQAVADTGLPAQIAAALSAPGWFAVAAGVAILRYRLYDIDRVISRTASYAILTIVLAGVYVAGVVGFGALARALTGGRAGDLAVAASTLAVAALFRPLRRRVQALVDRRFDRSRYDARQTVEALAHRLRDETDLALLTTEVEQAVAGAVGPRTLSLWVRPSTADVVGADGRMSPDRATLAGR